MRIDVVHRCFNRGQRLLHATHGALARGGDHVVSVGRGAITGQLGNNGGTALEGMLKLFHYHHAATACDNESVTTGVEGPGCGFRGIVILGGQGAHGVEQHGQAPVFFLTTAGEYDVLLAGLDLLRGVANTVGAGGAGRRHGVVHTANFERGGQAGRHGTGHDPWHHVGPDAFDTFFTHDVDGLHLAGTGRAAGAGNQAGTVIGDQIVCQS